MLFCFFFIFTTKLFREIGKEIVFQHLRKFHQCLGIYPVAVENVVHGIAVAMQLLTQPSDAYAVFLHILLYKPSYMKILAHRVFICGSNTTATKKAFTIPQLTIFEVSARTQSHISTLWFTPEGMNISASYPLCDWSFFLKLWRIFKKSRIRA